MMPEVAAVTVKLMGEWSMGQTSMKCEILLGANSLEDALRMIHQATGQVPLFRNPDKPEEGY